MPTSIAAFIVARGAAALSGLERALSFLNTMVFSNLIVVGLIRSSRKPPSPGAQTSFANSTFSVRQPIPPWQVVIGERRVGGSFTFLFLSTDQKYFHMVVTLACHVSEEISEVWLDDEIITSSMLDGNGIVTSGKFSRVTQVAHHEDPFLSGTSYVTEAPIASFQSVIENTNVGTLVEYTDVSPAAPGPQQFSWSGSTITFHASALDLGGSFRIDYTENAVSPVCRIKKSLGAEAGQPFPDLVSESEGKWTDAHRQTGHTKIYVRFDTSLLQGSVPNVGVVMKGMKLYDPRTGLTTWSANSALAVAAYAMNTEFGLGAALSELGSSELITAANICDESVTLSAGGSELRYRANGAFLTTVRPVDVLQSMLGSMAGMMTQVSDTWRIFAGAYEAATITLTEKDFAGPIQIEPMPSRDKWANGAKGIFVDPNSNWQPTDFPAIVPTSTYLAEDGGETIYVDVDLTAFVTSSGQTQRLSRIAIRQARSGLTVVALFRLTAWRTFTGHSVALTFAKYGWSAKEFLIAESGFVVLQDAEGPSLGVQLTLRETNSAIYSWSAEDQPQPTPPHSSLPSPFTKPANVTGLSATSGTDDLLVTTDGTVITRANVSWDPVTDGVALSGGHLELQFKRTEEADFQHDSDIPASASSQYIAGLDDAKFYLFRIRSVSALGIQGDWSTIVHRVIGKTAPPSDVTLFTIEGTTLTWTPVIDRDVFGYLLKYQPGSSRSWGDAIPLHNGQLTNSPYDMLVKPSGPVTLMVKAVDSSGNESLNAAYIAADFGDPLVANIVETFDRKAAGFPGTKTNCSVSGGNLVADSITPLMWKPDDAADMWASDPLTLMWATVQYAAMEYDDTLTITQSGAGSIMSILSQIVGDPWSLEYRENSAKLMWDPNAGTLFWTADGDLMWDLPGYLPWPGQIVAKNSVYDFRIKAGQTGVQGEVDEFTIVIDMPDIDEDLNDVVISAVGTRLPIARTYRVIKNVQLTVQADGGTAISARIDDKNAVLGPLIHGLDAAGSNTSALVDARIQGY